MRIALCTTTINVPTVLELYRKLDPDVAIFIAGDLKSPHDDIYALCNKLSNARYLHPEAQEKWKCSTPIGWNCIQRRNIAYLEALQWGADIIVSLDDDNISTDEDYFVYFRGLLDADWWCKRQQPFCGPKVASFVGGWFDPGALLVPPAKHRGIPHDAENWFRVFHTTNAKVGVVAGMCLGDPDIAAYTRMACRPVVHAVSELLQAGIVVDSATRTVFNSQNTAFIRELAPAMFVWPGVGRYDDIFASLVCQRAMKETGHVVHFGKPFVWQQRNEHNLLTDLKNEQFGMENLQELAEHLKATEFPTSVKTVVDMIRWYTSSIFGPVPLESLKACAAWCDDCESVL